MILEWAAYRPPVHSWQFLLPFPAYPWTDTCWGVIHPTALKPTSPIGCFSSQHMIEAFSGGTLAYSMLLIPSPLTSKLKFFLSLVFPARFKNVFYHVRFCGQSPIPGPWVESTWDKGLMLPHCLRAWVLRGELTLGWLPTLGVIL